MASLLALRSWETAGIRPLPCRTHVATAIEPQLCEPKTFDIRVDTSLQREREKICVYGIGQQFVEYARLLTVPRVANRFGWSQDQFVNGTLVGRAACCWSPERLQQSFDTIAAEFKTANDTLSARSFARLSSEIRLRTAAERDIDFQSPGFDGLTLLNITDDEFREDLVILFPKARSYLHHYIEKLWNFRRPLPCPAGAYCNAGTCPRYLLTGIVDVDFDRPSNALEEARRLAETHYTEKLREVFYNRTWNVTIPPDMEQGEDMGGHANDSNDSSWSPLNRSDRWHKPSDCFDKNETEPQESKARTSAPKQDATFENFRVLSEFQQMSTETLGAPAPVQRLNEPMHQQYAVGKAAALAPELAFRQLLAHRKELSEEEWLRLWTNVSADIASKIWPNASANVSLGNWTWFAQNASGENITRRLQEETFLATTEYPLEAINPLSMRAPQLRPWPQRDAMQHDTCGRTRVGRSLDHWDLRIFLPWLNCRIASHVDIDVRTGTKLFLPAQCFDKRNLQTLEAVQSRHFLPESQLATTGMPREWLASRGVQKSHRTSRK
ncbi:unnamed protein product [Symbiodinium sp. CCMP2456]|nr:unnamed protein product [Symbiodinium sp. CCMP2456]